VAKKAGKAKPEERARRALVKAQLKLEVAQQEHTQERVRGQQEVEKARLRAQKWLAKAAQRAERRAETVAQAEAALSALSNPPKEVVPDGHAQKPRRQKAPKAPAPAPAVLAPKSVVAKAEQPEVASVKEQAPAPVIASVKKNAPAPVIVPERIPSMKDAAEPPKDTGRGK
jgi:hypothetical protein